MIQCKYPDQKTTNSFDEANDRSNNLLLVATKVYTVTGRDSVLHDFIKGTVHLYKTFQNSVKQS